MSNAFSLSGLCNMARRVGVPFSMRVRLVQPILPLPRLPYL